MIFGAVAKDLNLGAPPHAGVLIYSQVQSSTLPTTACLLISSLPNDPLGFPFALPATPNILNDHFLQLPAKLAEIGVFGGLVFYPHFSAMASEIPG